MKNSLGSYRKHGIPTSIIQYCANNNFSIPEIYADCFSNYYLLYWESGFTLAQIKEGQIVRDGIKYSVIYHRCTRGQLLANLESQVALSFRVPQAEFALNPVVLVSISVK